MAEFVDRWWISGDGLRLHARDYVGAKGRAHLPVICIHGLTRNAKDFEDVAPYIAATGRRVLAVDVRGRGKSERDPNPMNYQPAVYAQDVLSLFDALGIARAVFVGTSMGGLITMATAALRSRAVAAAVLNDIGPEVSPVGLARIASYAGKAAPVTDWDSAAAYVRRLNEAVFPTYGEADWMAFARRTFREQDGAPAPDYDPDIMAVLRAGGANAPLVVPDLWPLFRRLVRGRPTLLVRGGTSDLLSAEIAGRMRRAARRMGFVEVAGVGHAPMLTEPVAKEAVLGFLEGLA
jgi:pimeloyl-ACP methyl ester carboxylesterase